MTHMKIGVNVAFGPNGPQSHRDILDEVAGVANAGLASAWWPQLPPFHGLAPWDALNSISAVGQHVPDVNLGVSVAVPWTLHPFALAQQALTTHAAIQHRLVLGIGASHASIVEGVYGLPHDRPATAMREYLSVLRPALRGEPVEHRGTRYTAVGTIRLPDATPPPVFLAALGPAMVRVAAELADGVITTWCGPRALREAIVPIIDQYRPGTASRMRVVAGALVCVSDDVARARRDAAERFAAAAQQPSYRRMLDIDGLAGPGDALVAGDPDTVERELARFADSGATDFIASPFGTEVERADTLRFLGSLRGSVTRR